MLAEDRVRLHHMVEAGESAMQFVAGRQRVDLDQDRMLLFALVRAIEVLGEAANQISEETRATHANIPWRAIIGMRNRLIHAYFKLMWEAWNEVFRKTLGQSERSLVQELREVCNRWVHQHTFSTNATYRALDSAARLLTAVSAPRADDIDKMKQELLRLQFDEQVCAERRRAGGSLIEVAARYHGLRGGQNVSILDHDAPGLLVKSAVARRQLDAEMQSGPGSVPVRTLDSKARCSMTSGARRSEIWCERGFPSE